MKNLVFVGSHLGYPMDKTPLGGGAMVGLQLVRHWAGNSAGLRLSVVGSGSLPPAPDVDYVRLPAGGSDPDLVRLSEQRYADFCRVFEDATTAHIIGQPDRFPPAETLIVVNDISESPDLGRLARAGYRIASIWHVDVVDYFSRIYLRSLFRPERLTRLFARLERRGITRVFPQILRLVFDKQRRAVEHSRLLIMPSRQMADSILRCYRRGALAGAEEEGFPGLPPLQERLMVLPWGGWREPFDESVLAEEVAALRAHYQLDEHSRVLMTLSRISPEKGLHLLLEALLRLEKTPALAGKDVCLFICGEPAFMRGAAYGRRVREAAARLRRFRVFFPGYLSAADKLLYFRLAELFVSPSVHESYGLTLVEAMQSGLPILASDHYGVDEILSDEYGLKIDYSPAPARISNLAAGLESLLSDPPRLKRMGTAARAAAGQMDFAFSSQRLLEAVRVLI